MRSARAGVTGPKSRIQVSRTGISAVHTARSRAPVDQILLGDCVAELARHRHPDEMALARRIKAALDPEGLLNPGKVLARG